MRGTRNDGKTLRRQGDNLRSAGCRCTLGTLQWRRRKKKKNIKNEKSSTFSTNNQIGAWRVGRATNVNLVVIFVIYWSCQFWQTLRTFWLLSYQWIFFFFFLYLGCSRRAKLLALLVTLRYSPIGGLMINNQYQQIFKSAIQPPSCWGPPAEVLLWSPTQASTPPPSQLPAGSFQSVSLQPPKLYRPHGLWRLEGERCLFILLVRTSSSQRMCTGTHTHTHTKGTEWEPNGNVLIGLAFHKRQIWLCTIVLVHRHTRAYAQKHKHA